MCRCISPDFCLDWPALKFQLASKPAQEVLALVFSLEPVTVRANSPLNCKVVTGFAESSFLTAERGEWRLAEHSSTGDHVWLLQKDAPAAASTGMLDGVSVDRSLLTKL